MGGGGPRNQISSGDPEFEVMLLSAMTWLRLDTGIKMANMKVITVEATTTNNKNVRS